ncbi:MAG: sigma-70 family RNA polymerase sigma factor [Planctomycetes bacterium]|nr:sigma-70 family RNA polymerase sigma factor [Planctomycetota bacterium]
MGFSQDNVTRLTLLKKASFQDDHEVWEEFQEYYHGFITAIIIRLNVSPNDREDLEQTVLLKLWQKLSSYDITDKRCRFRTWLVAVIRNEVISFFRSRSAKKQKILHESDLGAEVLKDFSTPSNIDEVVEKEWKAHLCEKALEKVREQYSVKAMGVFEMSMKGKTVAEIAKKLDLTEKSVSVLKSRVKKRFNEEVTLLRSQIEEAFD